jgi:hypothetical protein
MKGTARIGDAAAMASRLLNCERDAVEEQIFRTKKKKRWSVSEKISLSSIIPFPL